jgi:hypothetical protein
MALVTLLSGYMALGSAISSNGVITEISGNGYARQAVTVQYDATGGVIYFNGQAFSFTGAPATVVVCGIYDASTNGNLILSFPIPSTTLTGAGTVPIPTGQVQLNATVQAQFNSTGGGTISPNTVLGVVADQLGSGLSGVFATGGPAILKISSAGALTASSVVNVITYASTIAPNAALANAFAVTLTGNMTMNVPTNAVPGTTYRVELIQDATGSRLLTLGTGFKTAGGAPTLTTAANAIDRLNFFYDGTTFWAELFKAYA